MPGARNRYVVISLLSVHLSAPCIRNDFLPILSMCKSSSHPTPFFPVSYADGKRSVTAVYHWILCSVVSEDNFSGEMIQNHILRKL